MAYSQVWDNSWQLKALKIMKNAVYCTSKAVLVLKIFKFLSRLFGHVAKRLDRKDRVNFNFFDARAWLTNNCNAHIAWVSVSQLIECNMRNIFLEKSYTKCGGKNNPRLFSENIKINISLDQLSKVFYSLFLLYAELRAIEYTEIKLQTTPAFTSY